MVNYYGSDRLLILGVIKPQFLPKSLRPDRYIFTSNFDLYKVSFIGINNQRPKHFQCLW